MPTPITFGAISARAFGFLGKLKAITDAYFKYVTLLLHGNGTNGAQNNTFLDGSTNAFTITRNGNTTQGSFSPFSQTGWSNFFDGSTSYLTVPAGSSFAYGTGNFTIEAWVFLTVSGSNGIIYSQTISGTNYFVLVQDVSNTVSFIFATSGGGTYITSPVLTLNSWNHIAVCRTGTGSNQTTIYLNGVGTSGTCAQDFTNTTYVPTIGRYTHSATLFFNGYISNLRVVKGTAVYTGNFTPPTAPLTAITNTSLLTCQSNRFIDNSTNAFAVTANGSVRVEAFSPFNPSTTYSTANVGGSGYFDGTGDYLSVADSTAFDLNSTYTTEFWFYQSAAGDAVFFNRGGGAASWSNTNGNQFSFFVQTGVIYYQFNNGSGTTPASISTTAPAAAGWHHIAVGYNGTTTRVWLDGASIGTSTSAYSLPTTRNLTYVGISVYSTLPTTGYISNLRVVKGTDVYGVGNTSITVPTAPLTAITNTSLLCNFTNAGIFDNASQTVLETVGNAQVSTAQSKFGGASMYFDGTGDWLTAPDRPAQRFGTADFTVEGWLYLGATGAARGLISKGTASTGWSVNVTSGNKLQFSYTASNLTGTSSLSASTWYYFTAMRTGGSIRVYLNGAQEVTNSTAITDNFNQTNILYVGANRTGGDALNGYLDDIRITNGYARYNNFTVPSAALTPTAYTAALPNTSTTNGAQNNTFLDGSTNNFTITRNGNTTQGTFSPFSNSGWSNYFDGTGDYLSAPSNVAFALSGSDFTIEGWIYLTAYSPSYGGFFSSALCGTSNGSTSNGYQFTITATSSSYTGINFFARSGTVAQVDITGTQSIFLNTWTHIAVTKSGTTYRLFVNGAVVNTVTNSNAWTDTNALDVGQSGYPGYQYSMPGYISNFRLVKGTAVYTSAFTPPTSPLTAITNTSLLTCQSNRFIDNSANAFTITRNGDVSVQAYSPFTPAAYSSSTNGGSGYFDGTGDYLSIADSATIRFGTGNFTIQAWIYRAAAGVTHTIAAKGGASTGWVFQVTSTNVLRFTDTTTNIDTTTTISASTWTHVAVVRSGTGANQLKLYINAVDSATGTSSTDFNQTEQLNIGADRGNANTMNGYISSLKYNVGTAETITVPTAPLTGGTVLLNYTNAGIYDAIGINNYETVGNAQASTTQAKFGTTSMYFDGTDDRLVMPARPPLSVGSGNFTIEGWVYRLDTNVRGVFQLSGTTGGLQANTTTNLALGSDTGSVWRIYCNNSAYNSTATWVINTWYHFALVRNGATTTLYINGTSVISQSDAVNYTGQNLCIGGYYSTLYLMNGYIDDLRITPGQALYPGNFTPPTAPFPNN